MLDILPLIAEFLGTFLLVLSILATGNPLVIGATLTLIIWLISKISGGYLNPAVSLMFFLKGNLNALETAGFMGSQFLAAAASFYTYKMFA